MGTMAKKIEMLLIELNIPKKDLAAAWVQLNQIYQEN